MIIVRQIQEKDNHELAKIIRETLTEFGANKPGTVFYDRTTDMLSTLFDQQTSAYFVAEQDGKLLGGGGIFPTKGLPSNTCELVKMYLSPEARGKKIGRKIIDSCFAFAKKAGYQKIYIESMPELSQAVSIYKHLGFHQLDAPLGQTGHYGCDIWMLKKL